MSKEKKELTYEDLFKDYKGDYQPHEEVITDNVGRERIWEMSDEEYHKLYPKQK